MIRLPKRLTFRMSATLYQAFCEFRREAGSPWWDESEHVREAIKRYIASAQAARAAREAAARQAPSASSDKKPAKRRTRTKK